MFPEKKYISASSKDREMITNSFFAKIHTRKIKVYYITMSKVSPGCILSM